METLKDGLYNMRLDLLNNGVNIKTDRWQGMENPPEFIENLHVSKIMKMGQTIEEAREMCNPMLPWADEHFAERVSGQPLNPPPSHKNWLKGNEKFFSDSEKFSHSYPERFWSKSLHTGIRFDIGDYNDLIELLKKDKFTRQAYLPIFFPEDLGAAVIGERIPCTLGYNFIIRDNKIDLFYPMRSCDVLRHLHNDLYMANLLALDIRNKTYPDLEIGVMHFTVTSLHCFANDRYPLSKSVKK